MSRNELDINNIVREIRCEPLGDAFIQAAPNDVDISQLMRQRCFFGPAHDVGIVKLKPVSSGNRLI